MYAIKSFLEHNGYHNIVVREDVGETINVLIALRRLGEISRAYTLFLHTYPVDETRLITQIDRPLCLSYPPTLWRDDETVIHTYTLPMPNQAGQYRIALGIYDGETFERLQIEDSMNFQRIDESTDVAIIGTITVED